MPINLSWKAEDLSQLKTTKTYLSLSSQLQLAVDGCVLKGANTPQDFQLYSNTITAVLMETREFSMLNIPKKEIFKAALKPRIKDISREVILENMMQLILWVHAQMGFAVDSKVVNSTIDHLVDIIQKYHTTLTLEEIKFAFDKGFRKELGDWLNLSNATYLNWLREYTFCEDRVAAVKAIGEAKKFIISPPPKKLTPEESNEILKNGAINKWKDFKAGKEVLDIGNVTYNFLDGMKLIPFTPARKVELMEKAKLQLIDERKGGLLQMDADSVINHKSIKDMIEVFRKGIPAPTEKNPNAVMQHPTVIANTKRLALQTYFKEMHERSEDFIETLTVAFENWKTNNYTTDDKK